MRDEEARRWRAGARALPVAVHDKDDSEIEGGNPSAAGALSKKEQGGLMVEDLEDSTEPALISSKAPTRKN
jgi:hypothetical protein